MAGKPLTEAPDSPFRVPYDGSFRVAAAGTRPGDSEAGAAKQRLDGLRPQLHDLQRRLVANDSWSLLLVFQGMDAAGKDGTIRAVLGAMDPSSFRVLSFGRPNNVELDHDFLWRTTLRLPERGRIVVFNRSQYEEVLVVRVHPEILDRQQLPPETDRSAIWDERLQSIRDQELHLARNGTVILKFWLNVSADEQRRRMLARLDEPDKRWKFNPDDLVERACWGAYMDCYEAALNATSRPWAPWYAIPADDKPFMRAAVAGIVVEALGRLGLDYPQPAGEAREVFLRSRESLLELRAEASAGDSH